MTFAHHAKRTALIELPAYSRNGCSRIQYQEVEHDKVQPRFQGRRQLVPTASLRWYRTSATIDWLNLHVVVSRVTHVSKMRRTLESAIGESLYVESVNKHAGHRDDAWLIKFHDPQRWRVEQAVAAVKAEYGLLEEPTVDGLEVAVDFYPRCHTDIARHRMVGILQRHLLVPEKHANTPRGLPRMLVRRGDAGAIWLHPDGAFFNDERKRDPRTHSMYIDRTLQIGEKGVGVGWRVMDKTTDKRTELGHEELPIDKRRARVEVTLNENELRNQDIQTLDDLQGFAFEKLRAPYFPFFLPTVATSEEVPTQVQTGVVGFARAELNTRYRQRFFDLGVMGLREWEKQQYETRRRYRARIGRPMSSSAAALSKPGKTGHLVQYKELNERVRGALRNLHW